MQRLFNALAILSSVIVLTTTVCLMYTCLWYHFQIRLSACSIRQLLNLRTNVHVIFTELQWAELLDSSSVLVIQISAWWHTRNFESEQFTWNLQNISKINLIDCAVLTVAYIQFSLLLFCKLFTFEVTRMTPRWSLDFYDIFNGQENGTDSLPRNVRYKITTTHCVITLKRAVLMYFAAEAWNHGRIDCVLFHVQLPALLSSR